MAFWSSGNVTNILITWSSGKCKTLYLNFPNFYGLQTWQSSNLRWTDPILKVTWPSNYLVTWQMKKTYTSTFAIPMAIRLGRVVTYGQKTPHIKSCYLCSSGFMTNVRSYICTSAISMTTKLDRVVTCVGRTPASRPCDLLIMWSRDKRKKLYLNFHNTYCHQTWQSANLWSEDPTN